jgi:hypothetical protein
MPPLETNNPPPEPWHSFFKELDAIASEETCLQCIGGFVATMLYGLPRPTADVDVVSIVPREQGTELLEKAREGSKLHKRYGVYLQHVGIASLPSDYEDRLVEMYPGRYNHLRFFALEAHDLALSKLGRNDPKDREDILRLARAVPLDLDILKARYTNELRPYIIAGRPEFYDTTLDLWLEMIREDRAKTNVK